jgi:hypothetical protein
MGSAHVPCTWPFGFFSAPRCHCHTGQRPVRSGVPPYVLTLRALPLLLLNGPMPMCVLVYWAAFGLGACIPRTSLGIKHQTPSPGRFRATQPTPHVMATDIWLQHQRAGDFLPQASTSGGPPVPRPRPVVQRSPGKTQESAGGHLNPGFSAARPEP